MQSQYQYDWKGIEREYRLGIRSIADIGAEYGVTEGAILMCANFDNWTREQPQKVRTQGKERSGLYSADTVEAQDPKVTDPRADEKNDQRKKRRGHEHCEKLGQGIELVMQLLQKLKDPFSASRLDKKLHGFSGELDPQSIATLQKTVSLPTRARYAHKLTLTLSKLLILHRGVCGLNDTEICSEKAELRVTVIQKQTPPTDVKKSNP